MKSPIILLPCLLGALALLACVAPSPAAGLEPLRYNNPGLVVDLGAGLWAWPIPMDYDGDGDLDLLVVCPDVPSNGVWFFENVSAGKDKMPIFKPGVSLGKGLFNISPSYVGDSVRVLGPGVEYPDFLKSGLEHPVKLPAPANPHDQKLRANQWKFVDFDGDGLLDLVAGVEDWSEYGWDNAYDAEGHWTHGPLHGFLYLMRNTGTAAVPVYAPPLKIEAAGAPIDVFGMPSPNFVDFDGDGDLDLICGEFLDGFTYFENIGTRTAPRYAAGRRLMTADSKPLAMDLEMIVVVAIDWDKDGHTDLIVGDEDGRVAFIENTGKFQNGLPLFLVPRYFQQEAADLKFGALVSPVGADWDGDGLEDLICGNSAGYLGFFKNLGGNPPRWAAPQRLEAAGKVIRYQAGPNGSIQGPAEAKWGYTTLSVADWNGDGLPDVVVNSIWGKVEWFENIGTRTEPKLAAAKPIEVEWEGATPKPAWNWWNPVGKALVTQWRTTPLVADFNGDGLNDLAILDTEGYLAFFERTKKNGHLSLLPPKRLFLDEKGPLRLSPKNAGASGRRKLCVVDWDGDGKLDLFANSANASWFRNIAPTPGTFLFHDSGPVTSRSLAGHDTSATPVDFDKDGVPDLVIGAEDGRLYFFQNPRSAPPHPGNPRQD